MATNTIHLQNLRSWDILSGASANADVAKHYDGVASPKLPTSEQLEYGAIALNIAKGFETLAIKNNNDEIVYIPFNVVTKVFEQGQKLDNLSGVTDEIVEIRSAVSRNTEDIAGHNAIIVSLGENVSAITESITEINQRLNESVEKTDFEALGASLGFNGATYEPKSDELQGKTVTEAIDYAIEAIKNIDFKDVSEQLKAIRESVSANTESIKALTDIVDEMELVHAAVFVHLNSQLGFDDNGTYHPAHEDFEGLNVTEAIDALYDNIVNSKKSSERYIGKVSASTSQAIAKAEQSIKSDVEKRLAEAKTYTDDKVGESVGNIESELSAKIDKVANDSATEITNTNAVLENEIANLSNGTESKLSNLKTELEAEITNGDSDLETKINQLSVSTDERISEESSACAARIEAVRQGLSKDIDSKVAESAQSVSENLKTYINTQDTSLSNEIDSVSKNVDNVSSTLTERINENTSRVESLESEVSYVKADVNEVTEKSLDNAGKITNISDSLGFKNTTEYSPSDKDLLGKTVSEAIDAVYKKVKEVEGEIPSEDVSGLNEKVKNIASDMSKLSGSTETSAATISSRVEQINKQLGNDLSNAKTELSAYTDSKVSKLSGDVTNYISAVSTNIANETREREESDELIKNIIKATSGVLETEIATTSGILKSEISSTKSELENTISSNKSELEKSINTTNKTVETLSSKESDVEKRVGAVETNVKALSGNVDTNSSDIKTISGQVATISSKTKANTDRIEEIANYLGNEEEEQTKLYGQLGFDANKEFNPTSKDIQGKNVTEAIDYIYNQAAATTSGQIKDINSRIDTLESDTNKNFENVKKEISKAKSESEERDASISSNASAYTNSKYDELKKYADNTIATNAEKYTDEKVKELDDSLTDYVDDMGDTLSLYMSRVDWLEKDINDETKARSEEGEKLREEIKNVSGSTLPIIAEVSAETVSIIENTSAATTSLITKTSADTRDYVEDLFGETNEAILALEESSVEINKKADSALTRVDQVETVLGGKIDSVSSQTNVIKTEFVTVSEKAEKAYDRSENIESLFVNDELTAAGTFSQLNGQLGFNENAEYLPSYEDLEGRSVTEAIDYIYAKCKSITKSMDNISEKVKELCENPIISITHSELVELIDKGKLVVGRWYKIIDYKPTLSKDYINKGYSVREFRDVFGFEEKNAGFYILVFAVSTEKLDENALCAPLDADEDNDAYFDSVEILSWKIKYDTVNDTSRYAWANSGGTGVIYYMEDEFGNSAHYDFKNILKDKKFTFCKQTGNDFIDLTLVGEACGNHIGEYIMASNNTYKRYLNGITVLSESGNVRGNEFMNGTHDLAIFTKQLINNRFDGTNNITIDCEQFVNNYVSGSYNIDITKASTCGLYGFKIIN